MTSAVIKGQGMQGRSGNRRKIAFWCLAVSMVALIACGVVLMLDGQSNKDGRRAAPTMLASAREPASTPSTAKAAPPVMPASQQPTRESRSRLESEGDVRFDRLSQSDSPRDRFEAYGMARQCLLEAEFDRIPGMNYIKECSIQPGKWGDERLRASLVVPAALAGVPGAWWALREEGPEGRFQALAHSKEYPALEAMAYAAALQHADPFALGHESVVEEAKGNLEQAVTLDVASAASLAKLEGRKDFDPFNDPSVDLAKFKGRLPADTIQRAVAKGLGPACKRSQSTSRGAVGRRG